MVRLTLIILLAVHSLVSFVTLKDGNFWQVFPPFRDPFVYQIFSDLSCALAIVFLLCYLQIKKKNRSMTGLVFMMIGSGFIGTFAPLLFLLIDKDLFSDR